MAETRSIIAYAAYGESEQKFDYFVTGLAGALFAYIGQTYVPEAIHLSPSCLQPISLLLLAASFFLGLKRIETAVELKLLNHEMLHHSETAGEMTRALANQTGTQFNTQSGEYVTPEILARQREVAMAGTKKTTEKLVKYREINFSLYRYRNHCLLLGFIAIFLSKVIQPYAAANEAQYPHGINKAHLLATLEKHLVENTQPHLKNLNVDEIRFNDTGDRFAAFTSYTLESGDNDKRDFVFYRDPFGIWHSSELSGFEYKEDQK